MAGRSGAGLVRVLHVQNSLRAPNVTTTATQAVIGSSSILLTVDVTSGITADAYDKDFLLQATAGGNITIGGTGLGSSGVLVDGDGNPINLGTASADDVTLGNSSGGSVKAVGAVTLGGEAANTVTLGGSGSTTITAASASGDSLTMGASGSTVQMAGPLTSSGGTDIGSAGTRFGTVWANSVQATNLTATNMTYSNTTLAWSSTLLQDESAVEKFIGSPTACKQLCLDIAAMRALGYYVEDDLTTLYPMQWIDPRLDGFASEQIGGMSANVQLFNMMMVLTEVFASVPASATFNLVYAPMSTALRADFAGVGTCDSNGGNLRVQIADVSGLTTGDALVVTGFASAGHNGRHTITEIDSGGSQITLSATFAAAESASGANFEVQSQFTAWSTDIQAAAAVAVAPAPDITFSDVSFDSTTMGHVVGMPSGPFPLHSSVDSAPDNYFAIRITTAAQPASGKLCTYLFGASIGALT